MSSISSFRIIRFQGLNLSKIPPTNDVYHSNFSLLPLAGEADVSGSGVRREVHHKKRRVELVDGNP